MSCSDVCYPASYHKLNATLWCNSDRKYDRIHQGYQTIFHWLKLSQCKYSIHHLRPNCCFYYCLDYCSKMKLFLMDDKTCNSTHICKYLSSTIYNSQVYLSSSRNNQWFHHHLPRWYQVNYLLICLPFNILKFEANLDH